MRLRDTINFSRLFPRYLFTEKKATFVSQLYNIWIALINMLISTSSLPIFPL